MVNGCCPPSSSHRSIRIPVGGSHLAKTETFAIDFIQLRNGTLFSGTGARNEQCFAFGAVVYAVADGTVVAVRDGMPEETPNQPVQHVKQPGDYGGNSIMLAIAPGVYAFYAHLQPGSITVKVGDRVTTGQVLGKLGNTGNSTAPHLHFGLLDASDPLTGNSLPMEFTHWTRQGTITSEAKAAAFAASAEPAAAPASPVAVPSVLVQGTARSETATLPLDLTVAGFGS